MLARCGPLPALSHGPYPYRPLPAPICLLARCRLIPASAHIPAPARSAAPPQLVAALTASSRAPRRLSSSRLIEAPPPGRPLPSPHPTVSPNPDLPHTRLAILATLAILVPSAPAAPGVPDAAVNGGPAL
jgi:hypothetical protein